ncbi:hypothetical protein [Silvimonas iriomotensis]|uniref:Uncharacterized protein n=1 Tax=Silvimonas iriomotensis TaxID=449662 RepID=A0ABQ2P4G2_9NEIS|nr:hypothetical protein [Silvimonas iriomotensis]GGP18111.1 hypothetical protein GCM10010970_03230 [Silvimonas iriomotensis]
MSMPDFPPPVPQPARKDWAAHVRVRIAGFVILIAGVIGGGLIYWLADDVADATAAMQGRQYTAQLERIAGTSGVLVSQFDQWLGHLWHGKQLGITLCVLALLVAAFCFWLAGLMAVEVPQDTPTRR